MEREKTLEALRLFDSADLEKKLEFLERQRSAGADFYYSYAEELIQVFKDK